MIGRSGAPSSCKKTHLPIRSQLRDQRLRVLKNSIRGGAALKFRDGGEIAIRQNTAILDISREHVIIPQPHAARVLCGE